MKRIIFILLTLSIISFGEVFTNEEAKRGVKIEVRTQMEILDKGIVILLEENRKDVLLEHDVIFLSEEQPLSVVEEKIEIATGTPENPRPLPKGTEVDLEISTGHAGNYLIFSEKSRIPHILSLKANEKSLELSKEKKQDNERIIATGDETIVSISSIIEPNTLSNDLEEGTYSNTSTLKVTIISE